MGDPHLPKKKYKKPAHPWVKSRIDEEKVLMKDYGLKNKHEIWKMDSILRGFSTQAKRLIASRGAQSERERIQLMRKLANYGLVTENAPLDDVLGLTIRDLMEKRLQTLVFKRNLARSIKEARKMIVHRHIMVGGRRITFPSYMVSQNEISQIMFASNSPYANPEHPARVVEKMPVKTDEKRKSGDVNG